MRHSLKAALLSASLFGAVAPCALAATPDIVGKPEAARTVAFDIKLPLRNQDQLTALLAQLHDEQSPLYHHWLTPHEFGLRFGPDDATVARVAGALRARGLGVVASTQTLHVTGTVDQIEHAFSTQLSIARADGNHTHLVAGSALALPQELIDAGAQVMGFNPHVKHVMSRNIGRVPAGVANRYSNTGAYWFDDLKQAYSYPSAQATATVGGQTVPLNGTGVAMGVLMSSDVLDSDIASVFSNENWSTVTGQAAPVLAGHIAINGGGGLDGGAFDEASLDTQQELTGAPGAQVYLFNIPSLSDSDIFSGLTTAIEGNTIEILSMSFGGCELEYFPAYNGGQDYRGILRAYHDLFMQGNAQGITFLASSGDSAGRECPDTGYSSNAPGHFVPGVEEPADDPNVTAVGGTNLVTTYVQGTLDSAYAGENAWADPEVPYDLYGLGQNVSGGYWGAGGGYSRMWTQPTYQQLVTTGSTTARAVPDIGMQVGGCPYGISVLQHNVCDGANKAWDGAGNNQRSAVVVAAGGQFVGLIGTSVSSPEFAGALASLVELKGRMGNVNTYLYRRAAEQAAGGRIQYFHTNIPGYNGVEQTLLNGTYSLSTGIGTPIVNNLIGAPTAPVAGVPQTPSNP